MDLNPNEGVNAVDLDLANEWWSEQMSKYISNESLFKKWFLSTTNMNIAAFYSTFNYAGGLAPSTSAFVINPVPADFENVTTTAELRT